MKPTLKLRQGMRSGKSVVAIGAYDAFSARMIERAGFDAVYVGSYATEAACFGKPDLMLMSKTERLWLARNIAKAVTIPVIVDAEEGFGNAVSAFEAVQDFEAAGVAGIHLDDQQIPSKCPFIDGVSRTQLVSTEEMCGKIQAAVLARQDEDFVIIARTDVIGTVDRSRYYKENLIEEVVRRSNAYAEAGADAIFVMALRLEELDYFASNIKAPLVGIFATVEPHPISAFQKAGCQITIGSLVGLYAAAKGLEHALGKLKQTGDWNAIQDQMIDDKEFFDIVELAKYRERYLKFKVP
jgi:2-methylisocitrate lyase-like PEP mutase family enzyme